MRLPPENQHVTYQLQYRKCGKTSCSTCRNGSGHGPYWYAYWREGTRLRSGYVGKDNPKIAAEAAQENGTAAISSSSKQTHDSQTKTPHLVESFVITSVPA